MLNNGAAWTLAIPLLAAWPCTPQSPSAGSAWIRVPTLGVQIEAPGDCTVQGDATTAFVSNGAFKANLFVVDNLSAATAADERARLASEPGARTFTRADQGATTWRFDYQLATGAAGTVSRIAPGRPLDCSIHNVTPATAAATGAACATVKPL